MSAKSTNSMPLLGRIPLLGLNLPLEEDFNLIKEILSETTKKVVIIQEKTFSIIETEKLLQKSTRLFFVASALTVALFAVNFTAFIIMGCVVVVAAVITDKYLNKTIDQTHRKIENELKGILEHWKAKFEGIERNIDQYINDPTLLASQIRFIHYHNTLSGHAALSSADVMHPKFEGIKSPLESLCNRVNEIAYPSTFGVKKAPSIEQIKTDLTDLIRTINQVLS